MNPSQASQPLTAAPAILTDRQLRGAMRVNILAGSLGMVWVATILGIPLVMLLEGLGASGVMIGLATTIQQVAMLAQVPASLVAERFASRKRFWAVTALTHRLLWFLPPLLVFLLHDRPLLVAQLVLLVLAVSSLLGQAATPCWFSWMADLIPQSSSARFWSRRQSAVMAAFLAATLVIGYLLDIFPDPREPGGSFTGFVIVFLFGAVFGTADILVHLRVPEPKGPSPSADAGVWRRIIAAWRIADFRWLTLAMGAWALAVGLVGPFGIIYLRRGLDLSYLELSAITVAGSVGAILAGFQSGYVIDRLGARTYAVVLFLIGPLTMLNWYLLKPVTLDFAVPGVMTFSIAQPVLVQILANLAAGAMFSSIGLCQLRMLSAVTPTQGRTMAMAVHWTAIGCLGALGPILGGSVMDWLTAHPVAWQLPTGVTVSFMHFLVPLFILIAWLGCAPLIARVSLQKGDLPVGVALPRLWLGNPLRAVRNVYNIHAVTAAVSAQERASAVRGLGESRTAIAVADLIRNLDDLDYDVREAAVEALGKLKTVEATEALVAALRDPANDLTMPVIRALRAAGDPRSVDVLIETMQAGDSAIQSECARALGAIRDARAVRPLIEQLTQATNARVITSCAEALGRFRERTVIPRLLEELRRSVNRRSKRSLSLALADLLADRNEYYKLQAAESESRGSSLEGLLDDIRKSPAPDPAAVDHSINALTAAYEKGDVAAGSKHLAALAAAVEPLGQQTETWSLTMAYLDTLQRPWDAGGPDQRDPGDLFLAVYLLRTAVAPPASSE